MSTRSSRCCACVNKTDPQGLTPPSLQLAQEDSDSAEEAGVGAERHKRALDAEDEASPNVKRTKRELEVRRFRDAGHASEPPQRLRADKGLLGQVLAAAEPAAPLGELDEEARVDQPHRAAAQRLVDAQGRLQRRAVTPFPPFFVLLQEALDGLSAHRGGRRLNRRRGIRRDARARGADPHLSLR